MFIAALEQIKCTFSDFFTTIKGPVPTESLLVFNGENRSGRILYTSSLIFFTQTISSILDKRSSTGNLFFTDQFDNHPWENPELNLQG